MLRKMFPLHSVHPVLSVIKNPEGQQKESCEGMMTPLQSLFKAI